MYGLIYAFIRLLCGLWAQHHDIDGTACEPRDRYEYQTVCKTVDAHMEVPLSQARNHVHEERFSPVP